MKVQRMYEAKMVLVEYVSSSSSWIFRGQKNTHFATVDKNLATFWLITSNVAFGCCCMLLLLLKYWHEWKRLTGLYSLKLRDLCWMKHFKICKKKPELEYKTYLTLQLLQRSRKQTIVLHKLKHQYYFSNDARGFPFKICQKKSRLRFQYF